MRPTTTQNTTINERQERPKQRNNQQPKRDYPTCASIERRPLDLAMDSPKVFVSRSTIVAVICSFLLGWTFATLDHFASIVPERTIECYCGGASYQPAVACANNSSTATPNSANTPATNVKRFFDTASSFDPVTDKVDGHQYETMYGMLLLPLYASKPNMKMLEIGLGCDMVYGPGASVSVWKSLFPKAQLWEAEFDGACVNASKSNGLLNRFQTLVGDQGNPRVLDNWIKMSHGGNFDVVIDDGGHLNTQVKTSFEHLWPSLNKGGLYFIEDLQVGRTDVYDDTKGKAVMADVIQDWVEQILIDDTVPGLVRRAVQHPIPPDILFIFCQHEACVIGKKT